MRLVNVRDRFITLEVTPEDCLVLSAACPAAELALTSYEDHRRKSPTSARSNSAIGGPLPAVIPGLFRFTVPPRLSHRLLP